MSNKKVKGETFTDYFNQYPPPIYNFEFPAPPIPRLELQPVYPPLACSQSFVSKKIFKVLIEKIQNKSFEVLSPFVVRAVRIIIDSFRFSKFELAYLLVLVDRMSILSFKFNANTVRLQVSQFSQLCDVQLSERSVRLIGQLLTIFSIVKFQLSNGRTLDRIDIALSQQRLLQKFAQSTFLASMTILNKIEIADINGMYRLIPMIESNANYVSIGHMVDVIVASR